MISVDRTNLDPKIESLPNVDFRKQSAFGIDPLELPPIDWLVCDVACYPARLLDLIDRWVRSGRCRRMIATVKLQGKWAPDQTAPFQHLPGAQLVHLFHNKHELTLLWGLIPGCDSQTLSAVPNPSPDGA